MIAVLYVEKSKLKWFFYSSSNYYNLKSNSFL